MWSKWYWNAPGGAAIAPVVPGTEVEAWVVTHPHFREPDDRPRLMRFRVVDGASWLAKPPMEMLTHPAGKLVLVLRWRERIEAQETDADEREEPRHERAGKGDGFQPRDGAVAGGELGRSGDALALDRRPSQVFRSTTRIN